MPATMHSFYLRNMYLKNLLAKKNGLTLNGTPIDLSKVKVPLYFISTIEDHIAPWKSCYAGAQLFKSPVRFVLGGSGHIAGIINPPSANKYGYWLNEAPAAGPDAWLEAATHHAGSWWVDWERWAAGHGGAHVPARVAGSGALPALEDAPGTYVTRRPESTAKG